MKLKLRQVVEGMFVKAVNGRPVVEVPFIEALRVFAHDPAQGFKPKWRAGRALREAEGLVEKFNEERESLIDQLGKKESELLQRASQDLPGVKDRLAELQKLPQMDSKRIDPDSKQDNDEFKSKIEDIMDTEVELKNIAEALPVSESYTLRGEVIQSILTGEQLALLDGIIYLEGM